MVLVQERIRSGDLFESHRPAVAREKGRAEANGARRFCRVAFDQFECRGRIRHEVYPSLWVHHESVERCRQMHSVTPMEKNEEQDQEEHLQGATALCHERSTYNPGHYSRC